MNKVGVVIISILFFIGGVLSILIYLYCAPVYDMNYINNIEVSNYNKKTDEVTLSIKFDKKYNNMKCGFSDGKNVEWINIDKGVCNYKTKNTDIKYIYLKKGIFKNKTKIDSLLVSIDSFDKIYITKGESKKLEVTSKFIGKQLDITYIPEKEGIVSIENDKIIGNKIGNTNINILVNNKKQESFNVTVTSLINKRSKKINNDKKYLPCEKYSKKQADLLDDILENRIENAGFKTRAGVVEAARFLLFDFKYKIDYFFENGRLSGGQNYVDGEGRYYHKGLYLHESKFAEIDKSFSGPAIWGCPLMNFEDYGYKYKNGSYNSNGLDCSGFVAWAFINGGFDIGDKGSGDNEKDDTEINDIGGEKVFVTDELFESNKVKAGDLIGYWGHIGLIVGIDDKNIYVAESLWTFGGVAVNKYKKTEVDNLFKQVILLDDLYKKDGNYTGMWY